MRADKTLTALAGRLEAIGQDLLALPGEITAALRVRYDNYGSALTAVAALPTMLRKIAASWHKLRPGHPKLSIEAEVVELLIKGVERYTGEKLPSPRGEKRKAEFEFLRLLTARLLPELTDAQFRTALRHWDAERRAAKP